MIVEPTAVDGTFVIKPEPREDHRGFFARMFCKETWEKHGLNPTVRQCNASLTKRKGSVRGLHYQNAPHAEVKLVRCTKGRIFDVCVDIRPDSPTYKKWFGIELTPENHAMLYIPEGCAHGFQTLEDDSEVFYMVSADYNKDAEGGVLFSDPGIGIEWPLPVTDMSEKDAALPTLP